MPVSCVCCALYPLLLCATWRIYDRYIKDQRSKQKQTKINTRIICRYNYLSTNYNHFRQFVQTSSLVEHEFFFVLRFLRRSSFFHRDLLLQPQLQLLAHIARQHFTRNVSKPVYHYWLNSWLDLSILLHLRVRVTALGLGLGCGLRSYTYRERNLAQQLSTIM